MKICGLLTAMWLILCNPSIAGDGVQSHLSNRTTTMTLSGKEAVNGSTILLQIDTSDASASLMNLRVRFHKHTIPLYRHPLRPNNAYFGLIAIPMQAKLGPGMVTIEWEDTNGAQKQTIPIRIIAGNYRTDKLSVDPRKVDLNKKDLARVKREKEEIQRVYASGSSEKLWQGRFQLPIKSTVTSPFGNKRMFNGQLRSFHNGVDFRAPEGKPIYAANAGVVKLAKSLFFSGNIIIVDHGTGIFSNYAHLSRIDVEPGQRLQKRQLMGYSGATGRVSGPHLHWAIKVNGIYIDPLQFVDVIAAISGT
ncbi:MAG: M23 family metallopeptidase [Desulfobacterales bacterium]|jgi:murein DD-endopeptidase MepM/ murein hydrolase activator NlpD